MCDLTAEGRAQDLKSQNWWFYGKRKLLPLLFSWAEKQATLFKIHAVIISLNPSRRRTTFQSCHYHHSFCKWIFIDKMDFELSPIVRFFFFHYELYSLPSHCGQCQQYLTTQSSLHTWTYLHRYCFISSSTQPYEVGKTVLIILDLTNIRNET